MLNRVLSSVVISALVLVGCDDKPATTATPSAPAATPTEANAALPANLRLSAAPADAKGVAEIKATAKDGQRVTLRGVVAGRAEPIAANRAILTLLDSSIKTCNANPGDSCKTPWDACCEPADVLAKNSVTVQVVDSEGRPLKTSLTQLEGLKPLAKLTVTGVVMASSPESMLINADGLFVK